MTWKLNNTLLSNAQVKEITGEIRKHLETNENEHNITNIQQAYGMQQKQCSGINL